MEKTIDVTALGELLIDFTVQGTSSQGNPLMEANPGGAPTNVLSMLSRLEHSTSFIGKVGDDAFGRQLKATLEEVKIATEGLIFDEKYHTTLAFVHNLPDGDREFSFYRDPGADEMLTKEEVNKELIEKSRIFHFGSLSLTNEAARGATAEGIKIAKESGCIVSFDPNLRESLWASLDDAKREIEWGIGKCDILKISDYEITWFTGEDDYDKGVKILQDKYNIPLILVSMGTEGSMAFTKDKKAFAPAYKNPDTVDTTGAGDTFCACILHFVVDDIKENNCTADAFAARMEQWTEPKLKNMLDFANAAASIETTRKGAIRVMPYKKEIEEFILKRNSGN